MNWQPISTAPKDGTRILIVRVEDDGKVYDEMEITEWCSMEQSHFEETEGGLFRKVIDEPLEFWNGNGHRATHWMPLPDPPKKTK